MNEAFQEHKRKIDYGIAIAQITTEGIQQAELIEFEEAEKVIEIPVYDMTPEEQEKYKEHKRQRNKRVIEKLKGGVER